MRMKNIGMAITVLVAAELATILLLSRSTAFAQAANVISVCVNQSNGAMRMLLTPSVPTPANCSGGEQFMQWNIQGLKGMKGAKGEKGDKGLKGDRGKDGKDGEDGKPGPAGLAGPRGPRGRPASPRLSTVSFNDSGSKNNVVTAPFRVVNSSGKIIAEISEGTGGGRLTVYDRSGSGNALVGVDPAGNGSVLLYPKSGEQGRLNIGFKTGGAGDGTGAMVIQRNGKKVAEMGTDTDTGQPAVNLWNEDGENVVYLGVNSASHAGLILMNDRNGQNVAQMGVSPASGNGGLLFKSPDDSAHLLLSLDMNRQGHLEFSQSGLKTAELAPGNKGTMGLRIFNESHQEVITLEELSSGEAAGGGGLEIHNASGGTAATIVPNKDGVGVFHGIAVPLIP